MDVIEEAHRLGKALSESKEVKHYMQAEIKLLNNNKARELYEKYCSANVCGTSAENFSKYNQANLILEEFLEAQKAVLNLLSSINFIISRATGLQLTAAKCGTCFLGNKCGPCDKDNLF